mgnify:CR=1 FL=1
MIQCIGTDDQCVDGTCKYLNNTSTCDDGDDCTVNDVCSDGKCIGGEYLDADNDLYVSTTCGGDDCDDSDPDVNPGVPFSITKVCYI